MSTPASPASRPATASDADFRERLLPGPGTWLVIAVFGATFGVVLVPLSITLAVVVGAVAIVVLCALVIMSSPVVEVREGSFAMGRARISTDLLGEPQELRGADWDQVMGPGFEPLAHHCTRGWIRSGVRVPLLDEEDPTTAWVASSRRPEDLAAGLRTARGEVR